MKRFFTFLGIALLLLAISCAQHQKSDKPMITVSILPQKYFVERIAGDRFEIQVLTPPGASPETYEPLPHQMKTLNESVLYIANGYLMFEDYLVQKLGSELMLKTIDLSQGIDLIVGDIVDHGDHVHLYGVDPHYWLAPAEVKTQAKNILDALIRIDPENVEEYMANYWEFISDIDILDAHIRNLLSESHHRKFLIYHPAFEYFARQYGLEQIALEMDGKEPTTAHMKYIVDLAAQYGLNTILIQSQFNRAAAEVVAKEIGGTVVIVDPLPSDWLQNMYEVAQVFYRILNP